MDMFLFVMVLVVASVGLLKWLFWFGLWRMFTQSLQASLNPNYVPPPPKPRRQVNMYDAMMLVLTVVGILIGLVGLNN